MKKACAAPTGIIVTGPAAALLSTAAAAGADSFSFLLFLADGSTVASFVLRFSAAGAGAGASSPPLTSRTEEPSCLKMGS